MKYDADADAPVRDARGRCVRCAPNEVGEAIGQLQEDRSNVGSRFEGYTNEEASEAKILRDVFEPGDAWFRTGDLMRRDEHGYFYFVDRIGDTFRWKGENVATSEVAEAICAFPGIKEANVYGVAIPGTDGRAGMATIVADDRDWISPPSGRTSSTACPTTRARCSCASGTTWTSPPPSSTPRAR